MRILIFSSILIMASCTFKKDNGDETKKSNKVTLAAPKSNIDQLMVQYVGLKDAFIKNDTAKIDSANATFSTAIASLKADTAAYNSNKIAVDSLELLAKTITAGNTIPNKLMAFKDITSPMKKIATGNSNYKLYVQHCPMAGDYSKDEKVYWLSAEEKVLNPFYPKTMARCGTVVDSILAK